MQIGSYGFRTQILRAVVRRVTAGLLIVLGMQSSTLLGQAPNSASAVSHQSVEDAWWTGPMLAPSANTLPPGHFLVEPYLYDVITEGLFNSNGNRVSIPHENSFGSLTYILYGVANKFTVGAIPTFGYNEVSGDAGSERMGVGDLTLQAQYRIHLFREGSWIPTMSIAVQETLPTGKYEQLSRISDAFGAGAFATSPAFYSQTFLWLPNGRILRMRFNVVPAFSRRVSLRDISVYGTSAGFRGCANPGASVFVDGAWEYSVTKRWVLALDATYRHQGNTRVTGYSVADANQPIRLNSGSSDAFGLAPAIEYNWGRNIGILLGVRVIPVGRNTALTISPALTINYVH